MLQNFSQVGGKLSQFGLTPQIDKIHAQIDKNKAQINKIIWIGFCQFGQVFVNLCTFLNLALALAQG